MILETKEIDSRSTKRWSYGFFGAFWRGHKPEAGGFCLYLTSEYMGRWEAKDVIWITLKLEVGLGVGGGERIVRAVYIPPSQS